MNKILQLLLNLIDSKHKRNIYRNLQKIFGKKIDIVFDIGGHKGETSLDLLKRFEIKKIFIFEPVLESFEKMSSNLKKYEKRCQIKKFNFALGGQTKEILINKTAESSSSTINQINIQSEYYKRKNKILKFFFKNKDFQSKEKIKIKKTSDFFQENSILEIDLMKIDTEGYEYFILEDLNDKIKKIKAVYFEHHYDFMIVKNYTFSEMHSLLTKNGFIKFYKSRMPLRKTFDYIYINKEFFNDKI
tara:strand:+ start:123 stop:857 length:735 start_codon:yes stop_codon:yes gene_type:complete